MVLGVVREQEDLLTPHHTGINLCDEIVALDTGDDTNSDSKSLMTFEMTGGESKCGGMSAPQQWPRE